MKKIFLAALSMSVVMALVGCKGTNEKRGDEHLKEERYRNAIKSYVEAQKKGSVSSEFYDNYTLALVRAAAVEAKKDLNSEMINGYFDKATSTVDSAKEDVVVEEFVTTLATVGKNQAAQEGIDYATILNAFASIETALNKAKARGVAEGAVKTIRVEAENGYVAKNLPDALNESDLVVREYQLLKLAEVAPENADVKAALNKSRIGTRGYFLIFGEQIGEPVSRRIDKWGYVMAFPSFKMGGGSLAGELQFWASTGNNTKLDPANLKLVSVDGQSVVAKAAGGWCEAEVVVGKGDNVKVEKKKKDLKPGEIGELRNEFMCSLNVSFSYDKSFVPDYVEYKDEYGVGRKFLGQ